MDFVFSVWTRINDEFHCFRYLVVFCAGILGIFPRKKHLSKEIQGTQINSSLPDKWWFKVGG